MTVELEGKGPGQARASLASSVSTALTESNRPTFKSRAISELRRRQPAHITRQGPAVAMRGWAIVRCPSRSELWTSWPEAEAQRDRRRQSVIKSQVIRLKTRLVLYSDNFLLMIHIHIALAVLLQCSGQACEKYAEGHWFESLHTPF